MIGHGCFAMMLLTTLAALISGVQDTQPASAPAASKPAAAPALRMPIQSEVYRALLQQEERATPILPHDAQRRQAAARQNAGRSLLLEGTILIDRPGKLLREGEKSSFRFRPTDETSDLKTLVLNPNSLLEAIERETEAGVTEFYITATVSVYHGENYLNLQKYRRQISHGNLSP